MPGISVVGLDSAGGTISGGGQSFVTVDGSPMAVIGDAIVSHGDSPHRNARMVGGTSWLTIDGIGVCKAGDPASCGHVASGQSWIEVS